MRGVARLPLSQGILRNRHKVESPTACVYTKKEKTAPIPFGQVSERHTKKDKAGERLTKMSKRSKGKQMWCMTAAQSEVVKDFVGTEDGHLSLKVGDMVTIIALNPDGWWAGALKGKIGTFPADCVKDVNVPLAGSGGGKTQPPSATGQKGKNEEVIPVPPRPTKGGSGRGKPVPGGGSGIAGPGPKAPPPVSFASKPVIPGLTPVNNPPPQTKPKPPPLKIPPPIPPIPASATQSPKPRPPTGYSPSSPKKVLSPAKPPPIQLPPNNDRIEDPRPPSPQGLTPGNNKPRPLSNIEPAQQPPSLSPRGSTGISTKPRSFTNERKPPPPPSPRDKPKSGITITGENILLPPPPIDEPSPVETDSPIQSTEDFELPPLPIYTEGEEEAVDIPDGMVLPFEGKSEIEKIKITFEDEEK